MNWPMCIGEDFAKYHAHNRPQAKFKIYELVILKRDRSYTNLNGRLFIVTGVGHSDDDEENNPIFEYSLKGFPYLCWESELEKL